MSNWCVYLLRSGNRTYVGSTTDQYRRVRQHNQEIPGGARATRGRKWELVCFLVGFPNRSSACRWERIIKCRARGLKNRKDAFLSVYCGKCPDSNKKYYKPPNGLSIIQLR